MSTGSTATTTTTATKMTFPNAMKRHERIFTLMGDCEVCIQKKLQRSIYENNKDSRARDMPSDEELKRRFENNIVHIKDFYSNSEEEKTLYRDIYNFLQGYSGRIDSLLNNRDSDDDALKTIAVDYQKWLDETRATLMDRVKRMR